MSAALSHTYPSHTFLSHLSHLHAHTQVCIYISSLFFLVWVVGLDFVVVVQYCFFFFSFFSLCVTCCARTWLCKRGECCVDTRALFCAT